MIQFWICCCSATDKQASPAVWKNKSCTFGFYRTAEQQL